MRKRSLLSRYPTYLPQYVLFSAYVSAFDDVLCGGSAFDDVLCGGSAFDDVLCGACAFDDVLCGGSASANTTEGGLLEKLRGKLKIIGVTWGGEQMPPPQYFSTEG
jgi:hypothetical protein